MMVLWGFNGSTMVLRWIFFFYYDCSMVVLWLYYSMMVWWYYDGIELLLCHYGTIVYATGD